MAEATIDELRIEIESDAAQASTSLEDLCAALELLREPVAALTRSNSGLDKLAKQIQKLTEISNAVSQISGFEQLEKAVQSLKALEQLQGAGDVSSYVKAIRKLADSKDAFAAIQNIPDVSQQITSIATALSGLSGLQDINITPIINALNKLPDVVTRINAMPPIDRSRISGLVSVLNSFRNINTRDISSFTRALGRLPTIAANIQNIDLTSFGQQIEQLANALEPLTSRMESAAGGLQAMTQILNNSASAQNANNRFGALGRTLGNLRLSSLLSWGSLRRLYGILQDCFNISSQYVENLNLFSVTMGEATDSAMEFAEAVNEALGVDTSDWVRYQGFFQSVSKGFGVASNKAQLMSQNLTQLSYDISSFYNLSVDEAYNKVQSGFAGELEPLRRLGFALDEATLKQVAFNHGITQSLDSMTQAQKSQLRYVAMIEQATAIGVTGDMSRTIDSASNGMRVLTARIQQFQRAVGNMLMPALSAVLPYLTAFVQVLTEGAQYLADMFGFELPKFDFSDVSNGYKDIEEATNAATAANEKFKGSLAGVDQLNIIGKHTETSGTGTGNSFDLDINLPSYDFLNGVESKTKEIAENMKQWFIDALPWIEAVGAAIGGIFVGTGIVRFGGAITDIVNMLRQYGARVLSGACSTLLTLAGGLAAGASSGVLLYNSIKNLVKGTGNLGSNIAQLATGIVIAGGAITAFIALGHPLGAIITGVGAAIGTVAAFTNASKEMAQEAYNAVVFEDMGVSIGDLSNKYSELTSSLIEVDKKIQLNESSIKSNKDTIESSLGTINDLTKEFEATGNMSEQAAQQISTACTEISTAITNNMGLEINNIIMGIGDSWDSVATKAGMAKDEVINAMYAMKSQGDEVLMALNKQMSEAAVVLATGDKGSAEYQQAYDDYFAAQKKINEISSAAIGKETSTMELEMSLAQMTDSKIALMSPEVAQKAIEDMLASYQTAISDMQTSRATALLDLDNLKATTGAMGIEFSDTLYEGLKSGIDSNFNKRSTELWNTTSEIYSKLAGRVGELQAEGNQAYLNEIYNGTVGGYFNDFGAGIAAWWNGTTKEDIFAQNAANDSGLSGVTGALSNLGNELELHKPEAMSSMEKVGQWLEQGLENGWSGQTYAEYMRELADIGSDAFCERYGIASPSKLFTEYGGYMMEGLANGITGSESVVIIAIDNLAKAVAEKFAALNTSIKIPVFNAGAAYSESDISTGINVDAAVATRPNWHNIMGIARDSGTNGVMTNGGNGVIEATFNVYSTVDLEGDTLGESVTRFQQNLAYTSNGR